MNIFGKSETTDIRKQSKEFADSIFPEIEPEIKQLISDFAKADIPNTLIVLYSRIFLTHTSGMTSDWALP